MFDLEFDSNGNIVVTSFPEGFKIKGLPISGRYNGHLRSWISELYEYNYYFRSFSESKKYIDRIEPFMDKVIANALAASALVYY